MRTYDWLMAHADTPIQYRLTREIARNRAAARRMEKTLLDNSTVQQWLRNLKPATPPQHTSMEHGSFDFCLENAALKAMQLGLHAGLGPVADAVACYVDKMERAVFTLPVRSIDNRNGFDHIIIGNMLTLLGVQNEAIERFMRLSLDEMAWFARAGRYDIYCSAAERASLKGMPKIWKDRPVIRPDLLHAHGYCYPLAYDFVGLHALYGWQDADTSGKIDAILAYLATDAFHAAIADGYGLLCTAGAKCHTMGWDPKYPGWYDVDACLQSNAAPRLLFFAQAIARYPGGRSTRWFADVLNRLEAYRTESGTYCFPAAWLKESTGYAVLGSHVSFGENRRKRNWAEIESTFYRLLLDG